MSRGLPKTPKDTSRIKMLEHCLNHIPTDWQFGKKFLCALILADKTNGQSLLDELLAIRKMGGGSHPTHIMMLPCPECGSPSEMATVVINSVEHPDEFTIVACTECSKTGPEKRTDCNAIFAWNQMVGEWAGND